MNGRLLTGLALAALAVPVGASAAVVPPAERAVQVTKRSLQGQHGQRWEALHPKYRAVVSKARFVACETKAAAGLGNLKIRSVHAEGTSVFHVKVPLLGTVDVNDVTLAIVFRQGTEKKDRIAEVESLWVAHRGRWVHIYSDQEYKAYRAGKCP